MANVGIAVAASAAAVVFIAGALRTFSPDDAPLTPVGPSVGPNASFNGECPARGDADAEDDAELWVTSAFAPPIRAEPSVHVPMTLTLVVAEPGAQVDPARAPGWAGAAYMGPEWRIVHQWTITPYIGECVTLRAPGSPTLSMKVRRSWEAQTVLADGAMAYAYVMLDFGSQAATCRRGGAAWSTGGTDPAWMLVMSCDDSSVPGTHHRP